MERSHIVIAGGGFGGLYAALELEKLLKRKKHISLTLINDENFFLFTPLLPEAAASSISIRHIVTPLRRLLRRTRFAEVKVEGIDLEKRVVSGRHSLTGRVIEFGYEHLVIALGGVTNYFGVGGAARYSIPIKTLYDAVYVRNHMIDKLEEAAVEPDRATELLTFVVVGGGLTGVEVTGALNDYVREAATFYPELKGRQIRVVLIEALPRLLPEMNERTGRFAEEILQQRGVEVMTSTAVTRVGAGQLELSSGHRISSDSLIWAAGVKPNPLLESLDIPKDERGRIRANEYLEVEGLAGVWAVGDCANIPDWHTGNPMPPTAQHAVRQGRAVAQNVAATFGIGLRKPFYYRSIGQMALVGERTGIADLMEHQFSGFFAWFLWRTYYLMQLPLLEKRVRVMFDWTLDLLFERDLVQLAVTRRRDMIPDETSCE